MCSLGTVFNDKSIWSRTFKFPMVTLPLFKTWLLHLHLCELQQVIELLHLSPFICKAGITLMPCCCPGNWGHRRLVSPVPHTLVPLSFSCGSGGQFPHLLPGSYPKCPAHHLHFSASDFFQGQEDSLSLCMEHPGMLGARGAIVPMDRRLRVKTPLPGLWRDPVRPRVSVLLVTQQPAHYILLTWLPVFTALIITWNYLLCLFPGGQLQKRGL